MEYNKSVKFGDCNIIKSFTRSDLSVTANWCVNHAKWHIICANCGEAFHSKRSHTKTCSSKCRKQLSRKCHTSVLEQEFVQVKS